MAKNKNNVGVLYTYKEDWKLDDQSVATDSTGGVPRFFDTGASRDSDIGKLDFEGFLSPSVIDSYAKYMDSNRTMSDGSTRDSDNWQKGIPIEQYMKSMWRHFFSVWKNYRYKSVSKNYRIEQLNALLFNVMGMLHEELKSD